MFHIIAYAHAHTRIWIYYILYNGIYNILQNTSKNTMFIK